MTSDGFSVLFGDLTGVPREDAFTVAWSRAQFELLAEGAMWAIPRSGLIFQRRGESLVLVNVMPWMPQMASEGITPEQLTAQQDAEYAGVRENFELAGITVTRDEEALSGETDD